MKLITSILDNWMETRFGDYRHKFHGLAQLVTIGDHPQATTIPDNKRIALEEPLDLITWIRQSEDISTEVNPGMQFGRTPRVYQILPLRWVIAHKAYLGEDLILEINSSLPRMFKDVNFKFLAVDDVRTIETDHEAIHNAELGQTSVTYQKHRIPWNFFAINLRIQFILCQQ